MEVVEPWFGLKESCSSLENFFYRKVNQQNVDLERLLRGYPVPVLKYSVAFSDLRHDFCKVCRKR